VAGAVTRAEPTTATRRRNPRRDVREASALLVASTSRLLTIQPSLDLWFQQNRQGGEKEVGGIGTGGEEP
jgi:hypothetical protein